MKLRRNVYFALLIGLPLFSCYNNNAEEKAARESEEEGFHLNISSKDGDVKIDASSKGDKRSGKDKDGFQLNISTKDGESEINGLNLDDKLDGFDLKIEGSGSKLDAKVLKSLLPDHIGWFKRSEYNFQNALGLVSNAEAQYIKGKQKVTVVVLGGAIGSIAGGFSDFFEGEFDLEDSDMRQKTGEWNGIKYVEGYDEERQQNFMHMVLDNRIVVMVAGENMSEWNFNWWWKRVNWKKLESN